LSKNLWIILGLVGQGIFAARFLVQWIASEKKKESHFPLAFWYLSLVGSMILLSYAIYHRDPSSFGPNYWVYCVYPEPDVDLQNVGIRLNLPDSTTLDKTSFQAISRR
jgi:hypothetical protein